MASGATFSALDTTGTAVFRIVESSACMKNATATSQGRRSFLTTAAFTEDANTSSAFGAPLGEVPYGVRDKLSVRAICLRHALGRMTQHVFDLRHVIHRRLNGDEHAAFEQVH